MIGCHVVLSTDRFTNYRVGLCGVDVIARDVFEYSPISMKFGSCTSTTCIAMKSRFLNLLEKSNLKVSQSTVVAVGCIRGPLSLDEDQ